METSSHHSVKSEDQGGKSKSPHEFSAMPKTKTGATCLQKASASNPLTEPAPSLPVDKAVHSIEAPNQRGLQHHQGSAMGQASETHPVRLLASRSRRVLFPPRWQRTQDYPLLNPPEVPARAHLSRLSQGVRPHTRSSLRVWTTKRFSHPTTSCSHPIQDNRLINSHLCKQGSTLVLDFYTFTSITLSNIIMFCSKPLSAYSTRSSELARSVVSSTPTQRRQRKQPQKGSLHLHLRTDAQANEPLIVFLYQVRNTDASLWAPLSRMYSC